VLYRFLFGTVACSGVGALVYSGAIPVFGMASATAYQQEISAPPSQVRAAIADTELRAIEMANPTAGMFDIRRADVEGAVRWSFRLDGKHVLELQAKLEPLQEGLATRVVATAEPGADYATANLSSGLKDLGSVRALFAAALEYELNALMPQGQRLSEEANKKRRDKQLVDALTGQVLRNPGGVMKDAIQAQREFGTMSPELEKKLKDSVVRAQGGWGSGAGPGRSDPAWGSGGSSRAARPSTDLSKYD
jgi:hypothetical protein